MPEEGTVAYLAVLGCVGFAKVIIVAEPWLPSNYFFFLIDN